MAVDLIFFNRTQKNPRDLFLQCIDIHALVGVLYALLSLSAQVVIFYVLYPVSDPNFT